MNRIAIAHIREREADNMRELMKARESGEAEVCRLIESSALAVAQKQHDTLVTAYSEVPLVYLASLHWQGVMYFKIGSTDDIRQRTIHLPTEFDNKTIRSIWVYPSKLYRKIERSVLKSAAVQPFKHGVPMKDGHKSKETFLPTEAFNKDRGLLHKYVTCLTTARDTTGDMLSVSGQQEGEALLGKDAAGVWATHGRPPPVSVAVLPTVLAAAYHTIDTSKSIDDVSNPATCRQPG